MGSSLIQPSPSGPAAPPLTAAQLLAFPGILPYVSPVLDLTQTSTANIIVPAVTGKTWVTARIGVFQASVAGAISAAATVRIGNNATPTNVLAASSGLTNATAFNLGVGCWTTSTPTQAAMVQGATTVVDVTIAATGTGGFAYTVQVVLWGTYL